MYERVPQYSLLVITDLGTKAAEISFGDDTKLKASARRRMESRKVTITSKLRVTGKTGRKRSAVAQNAEQNSVFSGINKHSSYGKGASEAGGSREGRSGCMSQIHPFSAGMDRVNGWSYLLHTPISILAHRHHCLHPSSGVRYRANHGVHRGRKATARRRRGLGADSLARGEGKLPTFRIESTSSGRSAVLGQPFSVCREQRETV